MWTLPNRKCLHCGGVMEYDDSTKFYSCKKCNYSYKFVWNMKMGR